MSGGDDDDDNDASHGGATEVWCFSLEENFHGAVAYG